MLITVEHTYPGYHILIHYYFRLGRIGIGGEGRPRVFLSLQSENVPNGNIGGECGIIYNIVGNNMCDKGGAEGNY